MHISIPKHASDIIKTLSAHGYEAYVVGGCVRDSILGKEPADWDITTSALPEQVKALFPRTIDTGLKHGTVTIMMDKVGYEVTTYRIDGTYEDHRRPNEVTFTSDLKEDLMRRDFTINAMAYNEEQGEMLLGCLTARWFSPHFNKWSPGLCSAMSCPRCKTPGEGRCRRQDTYLL